jgi:predicted deacylase
MLIAGIHGGEEWNTIALADEMITYLDKNPDFVPENVSLYLLRSLNPDGEKRGKSPDGRANENGVDLNRNFDSKWKEEWKRDGCWSERPMTAGESAESEPETQALVKFLRERQVQVLVSYHSAGLGIFPAGEPPDESSIALAKEIAKITGYQYPPVSTSCEFTGTLVDWALKQKIVAVDVELVDSERTDFNLNLEVLKMLFTWEP